MTQAELAALPELPAPAATERTKIIHGQRVTLPALPQMPWRLPEDPASITDEYGLAWEVVRFGEPPMRWKVRRPEDDLPQ